MSFWTEEEQQLIDRLRSRGATEDIQRRLRQELSTAMKSYIGAANTPITQKQIEYQTQLIISRYQEEIDRKGLSAQIHIKVEF